MINSKSAVWDDLLEQHINFEHEQVHVLTALYGLACCGDGSPAHIEIAKILELMKSSTLILDDFLDKAAMRNGIPSIYHAKGAETAVLTAEIIKSTANIRLYQLLQDFPSEIAWQAMCVYEETYRTICIGQLEDEQLEQDLLSKDYPTQEDCIRTITHTSAVFIQLPLIMGAILTQKEKKTISRFCEFGINIGLAYQIRDDLLDVLAPTALSGKPENGDLRNKKKKLPVICLRDHLSGNDLEYLLDIYNSSGELADEQILWIKNAMNQYDVINECKSKIHKLCQKALRSLTDLNLDEEYFIQFESVANLLTDFDNIDQNAKPF